MNEGEFGVEMYGICELEAEGTYQSEVQLNKEVRAGYVFWNLYCITTETSTSRPYTKWRRGLNMGLKGI